MMLSVVSVSCRLSVSNDLRVDAERDLRDISASRIEVHPLNKVRVIIIVVIVTIIVWSSIITMGCEA